MRICNLLLFIPFHIAGCLQNASLRVYLFFLCKKRPLLMLGNGNPYLFTTIKGGSHLEHQHLQGGT